MQTKRQKDLKNKIMSSSIDLVLKDPLVYKSSEEITVTKKKCITYNRHKETESERVSE